MLDYLWESQEKMDIKLIIWGPHKIIWGPHLGSRPQVWEPLAYSIMHVKLGCMELKWLKICARAAKFLVWGFLPYMLSNGGPRADKCQFGGSSTWNSLRTTAIMYIVAITTFCYTTQPNALDHLVTWPCSQWKWRVEMSWIIATNPWKAPWDSFQCRLPDFSILY